MVLARPNLRSPSICAAYRQLSNASTPAPFLLVKVRNDMKAAMKVKDSLRLDVLRGLIAEVTNSAKTPKPVTTDSQILSLIRKRIKNSEGAAAQFKAAKREDLQEKENAQIDVLQEYLGSSNELGEQAIAKAIHEVIGRMRANGMDVKPGTVMKALIGPEGALVDRSVDKSQVMRLIQGVL